MKAGKEIHEGVTILWHEDYYDGILSGIAKYAGEVVYFKVKDWYQTPALEKKVFRTFNIYKLTPEQIKTKFYWHGEFRFFVGTYCDYDYDEDQKKVVRGLHNQGYNHDYALEMYFERAENEIDPVKRKIAEAEITTRENLIGWTTYDVLMGQPWVEWRRSKLKAKVSVSKQKNGSRKV